MTRMTAPGIRLHRRRRMATPRSIDHITPESITLFRDPSCLLAATEFLVLAALLVILLALIGQGPW